MRSGTGALWERIRRELAGGEVLNRLDRLAALAGFRRELVAALGEEPSILVSELEMPLSDYFGWVLKARAGAVWKWEEAAPGAGGIFRPLASFGPGNRFGGDGMPPVRAESPLPRRLIQRGALVRQRLDLSGLSAEESELLVAEMDRLEAQLVVPITVNGGLWGFFTAGAPACRLEPAASEYDGAEDLYLGLYGLEILRCLDRRREGLPPKTAALSREEGQYLREMQEIWLSLKPRQERLKLLVVDEERETAEALARFFTGWGIEAAGCGSEKEAAAALKRMRPQMILLDLDCGRMPAAVLAAAARFAPSAAIFGTSTAPRLRREEWRHRSRAASAAEGGLEILDIFPKPCRLSRLAGRLFETAVALALEPPAEPAAPAETCLIVDDEREATEALKWHLESQGYGVSGAENGEEALALAQRLRPRLILLDLKLKGLSGPELIRRLRAASPESRVAVLTAWAQEDPETLFRQGRPDAYCLKPVSVEELTNMVEKLSEPLDRSEPVYA